MNGIPLYPLGTVLTALQVALMQEVFLTLCVFIIYIIHKKNLQSFKDVKFS